MIRLTVWLAAALCLAGCRAPAPTMKDVSPFGETRIEPPRTHSFGTPDSYYQPPGTGKVGAVEGRAVHDEAWADSPSDRVRSGDVALVQYDEELDEDDELAWGSSTARAGSPGTGAGRLVPDQYRPGSVARTGFEHDSGEYYGSIPEPSMLRILEASPIPGGVNEQDESLTPTSTPSRSAGIRASSSNNEQAGSTASAIQFSPMPVHDATQLRADESDEVSGPARDIAELPAVPPQLRDRLDGQVGTQGQATSAGLLPTSLPPRNPSSAAAPSPPAADSSGWRVR